MMKGKLIKAGMVIMLGAALMLGLATVPMGCALFSNRTVATIGETAVTLAAAKWLRSHPADRPIFEATVSGLQALADNQNYDPIAFAEVLQRLPLNQFNGPDGDLYVSGVVAIWSAAVQDASAIQDAQAVKDLLGPVLRGFTIALKRTAPA